MACTCLVLASLITTFKHAHQVISNMKSKKKTRRKIRKTLPPDARAARGECEEENLEMELDAGRVIKEELDIGPVTLQPTDMYYLMKPEPTSEPDTEDGQSWYRCEEETLEMELDAGSIIKKEFDIGSVVLQLTDTYNVMKPESVLKPDTEDWKLSQEPTVELKRLLLCNDCNGAFTRRSALVRHIITVHSSYIDRSRSSEAIQLCKEYNKQKHLLTNTFRGRTSHKCKKCSKVLATSSTLSIHMRTHMGVKPYKCTECLKSYTTSGGLAIHIRRHTGVKPYKCIECSKMFSDSSNLKSHMYIHTGVKPYKCTECFKTFAYSNHMKVHMRTHTGIKPYKCTECLKQFVRSQHLKIHMRTHTGVKPYRCAECLKNYTTSGSLAIHIRRHTGVKPYKCIECSKMFYDLSNMKSHVRTHTGVQPYKCIECSKTFSYSRALKDHMCKCNKKE